MPIEDALELLDRASTPLETKRLIAKALDEKLAVQQRAEFAAPGGLYQFLKFVWPILEPDTPMQEGWAMQSVCLHLEACADGRIRRLLVNISPGTAKSTMCSIVFPIWIWACKGQPGKRFINLSYSGDRPEYFNARKLLVLNSPEFKRLYPGLALEKQGAQMISNKRTGYCLAMGVQGSLTGSRGDFLIYDDPNNVTDVESDIIREGTAQAFREAASSRINNPERSVIIVIQQRTHQGDVSGVILDEGLPYVHLCIPCEYDSGRHCTTSIGWSDPRTEEDECFWPERYPPQVIENLKLEQGPHAWNGQYQQSPEVRGGGIIKRDYWQLWEEKLFPQCDFVLASLDPAYTSRDENDPSALTIWGTFTTKEGTRAAILLHAFAKRLELVGPELPRWPGETDADYRARTQHEWGLVEHVHDACKRFSVDHLLVESKASGHSVVQAMGRLFRHAKYSIELIDPKNLDKQARAYRVVPQFAAGQIWAPDKSWADSVISEAAIFPRGRHDDQVDSLTQSLWWLKNHGFLESSDEQFIRPEPVSNYKPARESAPLYPV